MILKCISDYNQAQVNVNLGTLTADAVASIGSSANGDNEYVVGGFDLIQYFVACRDAEYGALSSGSLTVKLTAPDRRYIQGTVNYQTTSQGEPYEREYDIRLYEADGVNYQTLKAVSQGSSLTDWSIFDDELKFGWYPDGQNGQIYIGSKQWGYMHLYFFNGTPVTWPNVYDILDEDYEYGETSTADGGSGGSFDNSSDAVDFASLPVGGAAATGMITMFTPTSQQLASFGQFLWTTLFDAGFDSLLTSLKKWVNDPIESVIQLSAFPVTPPSGSSQIVKFCGIRSDLIGTGVSMNKCTSQFMDFDFGVISTPAYWKQALDYSPYTQISIYLPYIGICPLKSDDVIDATLHLKYHIDLLTGGFSAELKVTKAISGTSLNSVLYNWSGNMSTQIPITSSNFSQVFGSMMTAVAAIGVGAVSGGLGAAAGGAEAATSTSVTSAAISGAGHGLAANIGNVINSKPHVTQSGRLDGTIGAMSQFTPYLIIERPVQSLSSKFQSEQGYPSNIVQTLSNLSGMTVCEAPILDGIPCTEQERGIIKQYLTSGVII